MIFSYNWLKEYLSGQKLTPQKIAQALTFHSFEVEKLEKKDKDWVLDIDILPNRACDCFSYLGIAREIAVITNLKFTPPQIKNKKKKRELKIKTVKTKNFISLKINNKKDCLRYSARVIKGIKIQSSPKWIQQRLKICGLNPVNNIVDIANYVMLETGQPIHVFDFDKIKSESQKSPKKKIIVRRAKKGEKLKTLDGKIYTLDNEILVIADFQRPIAIAGIKGGKNTGIDKKTKNLIIEVANFNQKLIRRASRKLKLKTDASWRFENGISPDLIDFARERVCDLIQQIAGGKISEELVDFYPKKIKSKKIKLNLKYLENLLGVKIPKKKIIRILRSLNFKICFSSNSTIKIKIPTQRLDIVFEEDVIEEIGRIFGYQNIPLVYPRGYLIPPRRNLEFFWQKICQDILKEQGFCEIYNYSFFGQKEKEIFSFQEKELVELENPVSAFNKYLRVSLVPNLIKNVKENLKFFNEIKIFEIGKIFKKYQIPKYRILEKKMLSGALTRKKIENEGFYELKGTIDYLLNKLGVSEVWYDEYHPAFGDFSFAFWHPGKCAKIRITREEIGFLGEIHPKVLKEFGIKEKIFCFDIDFEKLKNLTSEKHEYQSISSYPAVIRDLALLVPLDTKVGEVLNIINVIGGKLIREIDLFDEYIGKEIPGGKKNLAFHIIYQAKNRVLNSKEIEKIQQRIIKALEENPQWKVRK